MLVLNKLFILLAIGIASGVRSDIPRPRGVAISKASLYPPGEHFTCFDGLKTIKFLQVNDDFCDCADNSDEPGTSACPNGKFHCTNAGHKPKNLSSSRVNDGICDCCDGSDEYDSEANCVNSCLEMGRADREKEKSRVELLQRGGVIKNELIKRGLTLKVERDSNLVELEKRKLEAEEIRLEKERLKNEIETVEKQALDVYKEIQEDDNRKKAELEAEDNHREAEQTFKHYDSNGDGVLELSEIKTRVIFDKDRNGEVSDEEALYFLDEKERVDFEAFKSLAWPRIKPYLMLDKGLFTPPEENHKEEDAELENENYEEHDREEEELEEEEEETGDGEIEQVDQQQQEAEAPKITYDPETQRLIEEATKARNEFSEAERTVREIESEIREINDIIGRDYGAQEEFAPLVGECFNYDDREYTYKLCPFDRASQQPRNGGSETRLGSWDKWTGGVDNKYSRMLYNNGANCWNGPQRSADVQVECGLEHKLTAVSEPNRCEYHFIFQTPAACHQLEKPSDSHDEL